MEGLILFFCLQLFHITINPLHLLWNIYSLRAMRAALVAADAMVGLAKFRNAAVVAYQVGTAGFAILLVLRVFDYVSFIEAFVVMQEDGRDIDAVRAGHAIFAVVAGDGVVLHHHGSGILQEAEIIFGQYVQGSIGA